MKTIWATSLVIILGAATAASHAQSAENTLPQPLGKTMPPADYVFDSLPPEGVAPMADGAPACCVPPGDSCCTLDDCQKAQGFYIHADYLLWWMKPTPLPPLVTAGDFAVSANSGTLGGPGTQVLFGGDNVGGQTHSGARFTFGYCLGTDPDVAVEGSFFFLETAAEPLQRRPRQFRNSVSWACPSSTSVFNRLRRTSCRWPGPA